MLLFGTPAKLLDGGATESLLMEMLEMGYARRCFFGFSRNSTKIKMYLLKKCLNNSSIQMVMRI